MIPGEKYVLVLYFEKYVLELFKRMIPQCTIQKIFKLIFTGAM